MEEILTYDYGERCCVSKESLVTKITPEIIILFKINPEKLNKKKQKNKIPLYVPFKYKLYMEKYDETLNNFQNEIFYLDFTADNTQYLTDILKSQETNFKQELTKGYQRCHSLYKLVNSLLGKEFEEHFYDILDGEYIPLGIDKKYFDNLILKYNLILYKMLNEKCSRTRENTNEYSN